MWVRRCIARVLERLSAGQLGSRGERCAARYLRRQGMKILARNVRVGRGEIDLIGQDGETLVFVEVKSYTCHPLRDTTGLEKIDRRKVRSLRRSCRRWAARRHSLPESRRLDVVVVEFERRGGRSVAREVRWYPGYLELHSS